MKKNKRTPQGTPIVPKDFHEWYEEIKDRWGRESENSAYFALWKICQLGFGYGLEDALNRKFPAHSGSLTRWVSYHKSEAVESIINGYEVEEEPLYTVTFNLDLNYHLALDEGDGDDEISTTLTTGRDVLGYRYFLTEKEIKSADEKLWPFAVPVEKV